MSNVPPPLAPGATLGPYLIQERIGACGMGAVWRARDTGLDRTVAIKTIEGQFSERFERESKAIASLNHPNICALHDLFDLRELRQSRREPLRARHVRIDR